MVSAVSRLGGKPSTFWSVVSGIAITVGTMLFVWSICSLSSASPSELAAVACAVATVWIVSLRLPRGGVVNIDASVGLAAAVVLPAGAAVLACAMGAAVGAAIDRKSHHGITGILHSALTRPVPVGGAALVYAVLGSPSPVSNQIAFVVVAAAAGASYLALDAVSMASRWSVDSNDLTTVLRPLGTLYLGHLSIGVVLGLLWPWIGVVALLILTLLVLVMQYSYGMYLKTRIAYQETISVLAVAGELQSSVEAGHSQRVADLATSIAKQMGLGSKWLESLNYAALLHDIGQIGSDDKSGHRTDDEHSRRGADIVSNVPFLQVTRPLIEHHHDYASAVGLGSDERLGACIVGLCCEYDHLLADGLSHADAMATLRARHSDAVAQRPLQFLRKTDSDST